MTKLEFLAALRGRLSGLPEEDLKRSVDYYSEIIDDRMEDGLSEQSAVEALGNMDEMISGILADTSLPKLVKAKAVTRRTLKIWEIILLCLGSPVWLSLLIAAASVIFAVYIVLWSFVAVVYAAVITFAAGTVAGIAEFIVFVAAGDLAQGVLFAGAALVCAGLTVLTFYAGNLTAKGVIILGKKILLGIKRCLIGREKVS